MKLIKCIFVCQSLALALFIGAVAATVFGRADVQDRSPLCRCFDCECVNCACGIEDVANPLCQCDPCLCGDNCECQ